MVFQSFYSSPIGSIEILSGETGIKSIQFVEKEIVSFQSNHFTDTCRQQLEEYFKGERKLFSIDLEPQGTDFQKIIWSELISIPFGKTASYVDLANKLNKPTASRAIGNANSKNTILIVLPCHRIIGQDGGLVGYAGELWRKKWLLEHELKFSGGKLQLGLAF